MSKFTADDISISIAGSGRDPDPRILDDIRAIMDSLSASNKICANCGKGEEAGINLKACTACKMVKYCNRECQIAHRPQHKKECKKRAKKLHDKALFKQPPTMEEDCPICFVQMPTLNSGSVRKSCCGKTICNGCIYAMKMIDDTDNSCAFCRSPLAADDAENIEGIKKRVAVGDVKAIYDIGCCYSEGIYGFVREDSKAFELWYRAAELGYAKAYCNVGNAYCHGAGVTMDKKKAMHYWELGAMHGCSTSRYNLGVDEERLGNMDVAVKHYMIAVGSGGGESLAAIKDLYTKGRATKEDYSRALGLYKAYLDEIRSDQRDEAAASDDIYKYY